jgi:tRNA(fMet)-specific endonuclease VapC
VLLVDTNILIDHLRGVEAATDFIQSAGKENLAVTTVVEMELYQGVRNRVEYAKLKKELLGFVRIDLNESISQTGLYLSQKFSLSHQLSVADMLIAATALVYDLELRTYNLKDFHFIPGLKVSNSLITE